MKNRFTEVVILGVLSVGSFGSDGLESCVNVQYISATYTFYPEVRMTITTVFINNRTQAVRLPAELRLPESVKRVQVRAIGNERIISPVDNTWYSFFLRGPQVSADFMPERASQKQSEREHLE